MHAKKTAVITTYGLLCTAGAISFMLPDTLTVPSSLGAAPPASITLTGIMRDFKESHIDFGIVPSDGNGHYAGNHAEWLSTGTQRPLYKGGGFKVGTEWVDSNGRNIAPHLSKTRGGIGDGTVLGVRVSGKIDIDDEAQIDAFDSSRGPYGIAGNYGPGAYVSTNSTKKDDVKLDKKAVIWGDVFTGPGKSPNAVIDNKGMISGNIGALSDPYPMVGLLPPNDEDGDIEDSDGDWTIGADTLLEGFIPSNPDDEDDTKALQYDDLKIENGATLTIDGDLRIVCQKFEMKENASIDLLPEANLTLYVLGNEDLKIDKALVNSFTTEGSTTAVTINYLGNKDVKLKEAAVYATITAPDGTLEVDKASLCGAYIGKELKLKKSGWVHVDRSNGAMGSWNPAVTVKEKIEIKDQSVVNSWDSNDGPYDPPAPKGGGTNWGESALVVTNAVKKDQFKIKKSEVFGDGIVGFGADPNEVLKLEDGGTISGYTTTLSEPLPIPVVTPPDLGLPVGSDLKYDKNIATISSNMRVKKLEMKESTLWISGDVIIRVDGDMKMEKSQIQLLPDASLTIYYSKNLEITDASEINTVIGNPQLVSIRRVDLGKKGKIKIDKQSKVVAWMQGAKTTMEVKDHSEYYGSFIGRELKVEKSEYHVDMAYLITCVDVNDTDGTQSLASDGMVSSAATFEEWYKTVSGVNMAKPFAITLARNGVGIYEYLDSAFYPIDGDLMGNEGDLHNNFFTYAIHAKFVYSECSGQFIQFSGGDGAWAFINWKMVMDLGNINWTADQYIDLDRLGLTDGKEYDFHIFHAHRNQSRSEFKLRTNIEISTEGVLPSEASYD